MSTLEKHHVHHSRFKDHSVTSLTDSSSGNSVLSGAACSSTVLNVLCCPLSKRCENIATPLCTAAQQLSVAGMKKERGITSEDWPRWTLGGSETKWKRMECDWNCFTLLLWVHWGLDVSDKGWHLAWMPVNWHATHMLITPNNLFHCYLPFNSQLSVRSYSVAPRNPCVLFSLFWQVCVRFHLLPLLARDREVKNLPVAGGSMLTEMWMTSR